MHNKGFTLVELAIVIVIIGLLVAGVLQGRALIRQSQMQSIIKQIGEYKAANIMFRDQYRCLPGDCLTAHTFFGNDCSTTASECNGNGNLQVEDTTVPNDNEIVRFWQHLVQADLIKGGSTGVGNTNDIGVAVPATRINNVGINVYVPYLLLPTVMKSNHFYMVGKTLSVASTGHTNLPFLGADEAYSMDLKVDDGMPSRGLVGVYHGWARMTNCYTGSDPTSVYNVGYAGEDVCHILFNAENF